MKNLVMMLCLFMLICACSKTKPASSNNQAQEQPTSKDPSQRMICGETTVLKPATGQLYQRTVYCD